MELSHTRSIAPAPSNHLVQITRQHPVLFSFLIAFGLTWAYERLVFEVPITVGSIGSKEGKHMLFAGKGSKNRKSRDAQRSIRSVIHRTMSRWLLLAAGASLVLSALSPSRVAAAPWSLAQSLMVIGLNVRTQILGGGPLRRTFTPNFLG